MTCRLGSPVFLFYFNVNLESLAVTFPRLDGTQQRSKGKHSTLYRVSFLSTMKRTRWWRSPCFASSTKMTKTWSIGTSSSISLAVSIFKILFHSYELQVAAAAQGKGLGKRLLMDLEKICKGFDMEKITLTVLKCKNPPPPCGLQLV